ncbi:hypothetical protein BuS5_00024 [Desulfosarcina sp. BuS5]|uniref:nucleotidyltransferase domain-containing protein n=1 Tax=Desulfosarcina sp. BuS5 TaxID=933262 RepID=UPI000557230D|nr:nucleotidyltransferase domain-containing protein [Desulfosarcina sp. BuS5]WDN87056.1 hypothetical protein BuS5_00024 [Desulfosarcina sp. BuS5]
MLDGKIKSEILQCLKNENLHKIILFGSYAYGTPCADSDIDLIVVSNARGMSKNYKDYLKRVLQRLLLSVIKTGGYAIMGKWGFYRLTN